MVSAYPHRHRPLDSGQLHIHDLLDDPLLVALPAGHRLASAGGEGTTLRLAELAGERWIEGFPESSQILVEACLRAGFRPQIDFQARDWTAKQGFVAAGLGLALAPLLAAAATRPDIVLRSLHPEDAPIRTIHAATRRGATAPPVSAFLDHLQATARDLSAAWNQAALDGHEAGQRPAPAQGGA
jgi:DNA-binding transcriptional LysR family regulator